LLAFISENIYFVNNISDLKYVYIKEFMVSMFLTNLYIILYFAAKKIYRLKACSLNRALGRFLSDSITFRFQTIFVHFLLLL